MYIYNLKYRCTILSVELTNTDSPKKWSKTFTREEMLIDNGSEDRSNSILRRGTKNQETSTDDLEHEENITGQPRSARRMEKRHPQRAA